MTFSTKELQLIRNALQIASDRWYNDYLSYSGWNDEKAKLYKELVSDTNSVSDNILVELLNREVIKP